MFRKSGVYIGWLGYSNLGDELMFELCKSSFREYRWHSADIVERSFQPKEFSERIRRDWRHLAGALGREIRTLSHVRALASKTIRKIEARRGEAAILGGGTIINLTNPMFDTYCSLKKKLGRPVPVFGAGVADPHFWSHRPRYRDRRVEWIEAMSDLPLLGVRGPDSKDLLDECGAKNVVIVGDPVVLAHKPAPSAVKPRRQRPRIGVNCGVALTGAWRELLNFNEEIGIAASALSKAGYEVEFFAVAPEDIEGCLRAHSALRDSEAKITLINTKNGLAHISNYDLVIAVKLHSAILAAACSVPFLMLDYRPKCRDFTRSIGWERYRLRIDEIGSSEIINATEVLLANAQSGRTHLCNVMCSMKARFEAYCDVVEQMLAGNFDRCPEIAEFGEGIPNIVPFGGSGDSCQEVSTWPR